MAVKKNQAVESKSKTARSMAKKALQEETFKASPDIDRIISLCKGEWAYLQDPRTGKLLHIKVGSDNWNQLMEGLMTTTHAAKIQGELEKLGWTWSSVDMVDPSVNVGIQEAE